jgi:hypothetical protein
MRGNMVKKYSDDELKKILDETYEWGKASVKVSIFKI